jgi:hypothetical protein
MEEEGLWRLTKKVMEEGPGKCFIFDKLPVSKEHEAQIPKFQEEIEGMGFEIFKINGHQFMTSDGVYRIVKRISDTQYE